MEAKNLGEKKSVVVVGTGCGLQVATTILDVASKPKKSTNRSVIFIFEERTRGGWWLGERSNVSLFCDSIHVWIYICGITATRNFLWLCGCGRLRWLHVLFVTSGPLISVDGCDVRARVFYWIKFKGQRHVFIMGPVLSIKLFVENFFPFVKYEAHVSIWKNIYFLYK